MTRLPVSAFLMHLDVRCGRGFVSRFEAEQFVNRPRHKRSGRGGLQLALVDVLQRRRYCPHVRLDAASPVFHVSDFLAENGHSWVSL